MWTYNSIRIYVQEKEETKKQIIARLQPLNAGTVRQFFGWETPIIQLQCKVVGSGNVNSLKALAETGTAYTLVGPGFSQDYYLSSLVARQDNFAYQTIDPLQDCETPVFTVTMELYE